MTNTCEFSPCRKYRYTLLHKIDADFELLRPNTFVVPKRIMWIGLNPSTADENQLDPTLRRIRAFSLAWGYTEFVMTNLFAFRATDPRDMKREREPVGQWNDTALLAQANQSDAVIAAWGAHGSHLDRASHVARLLTTDTGGPERKLMCLGINADGSPKHPLYVAGNTQLAPW